MLNKLFVGPVISLLLLAVSTVVAQAACSVPVTLTNGTTADATQVMTNFNGLAGCFTNPSFTGTATIQSSGYGALGVAPSVAAGGVYGPGLVSYGSALNFDVGGAINFITGATGNVLSATIASNGNLTVYGSGTTCVIGSGTGATSCTSDRRLKTNIEPISGKAALDGLAKISGVTYKWADPVKDRQQQVGVIAQQVKQAFPQLVGNATTLFRGKSGVYLTVDYAGLVSPLISAVNELNRRVRTLQASPKSIAVKTKTDLDRSASNVELVGIVKELKATSENQAVEIERLEARVVVLQRKFGVQTAQK